jgi:hypothetical protein
VHPLLSTLAPPPDQSTPAVPQALPSIEVWTRGVKATCGSPLLPPEARDATWPDPVTTPASLRPCTYVYSAALGASLTSASPSTLSQGTLLSISGSGFAVTPFVQLVSTAGTVDCDVVVYTASSCQCRVGAGPSGVYSLKVVVGTW